MEGNLNVRHPHTRWSHRRYPHQAYSVERSRGISKFGTARTRSEKNI